MKIGLKEHIKNWNIETIIGNVFYMGMEFMAKNKSNEDAQKYKSIIVKEIKRRIKRAT